LSHGAHPVPILKHANKLCCYAYFPSRQTHGIFIAVRLTVIGVWFYNLIGKTSMRMCINQGERRETMLSKTEKVLMFLTTVFAFVMGISPSLFAAETITENDPLIKVIFSVGAMVGAGLAMGLGAIGAGAGIGNAAAGASEAVGRNPGVQGKIMMTMMVGMAMAESIAIYALVIALILLYVNPYKTFLFG